MHSYDEMVNEQVLQEMRDGGDDLILVRPIYFQFVFPSEESAQEFAADVGRLGSAKARPDSDGCVPELPWEVHVTVDMRPELATISDYEKWLDSLASVRCGRADGWYCERIVRG
jgi:hypothetical protein